MYNPTRFKSEDLIEAFKVMDNYPFATVISVVDGKPFISHLPLTPKINGEKIELIGHLAKANTHWKFLNQNPATILFQGAQTYITPKWYAEDNVPTWNYSVVHVTGEVELFEKTNDIIHCLKELTAHAERLWPSGWEFFIPDDLSGDALSQNIVGFKIRITDINFKRKLSQNRSKEDFNGVLKGLETRSDDNSRSVLAEMKKLNQPM